MSTLKALRDAISVVIRESAGDDELGSKAILDRVRKKHGKAITAARRGLEDIALTKLINDVGLRKTGTYDPDQIELFGGYQGVPALVVVKFYHADGTWYLDKVKPHLATPAQIDEFIIAHSQDKPGNKEKWNGLRRMADDARAFVNKDHPTVEEGLASRRAAEPKKGVV